MKSRRRNAKQFKMDGVPVPLGDVAGRYELTVAEFKFSLVTASNIDSKTSIGEDEEKEGLVMDDTERQRAARESQRKIEALDSYLREGGDVFLPVKVPTKGYTPQANRSMKPLSNFPGSSTQCLGVVQKQLTTWFPFSAPLFNLLRSPTSKPSYFEADINVASERPASIRGFSWHPTLPKWAVVLPDDKVYFRDLSKGAWEPLCLQHQFQNNVNCMRWVPVGNKLAVGCDHGICLWTFVSAHNTRQTAWMQFLPWSGFRIRSLEWSPCGRYLASTVHGSSMFYVWDVAKGNQGATPFTAGSEVTGLRWSPDSGSLFVGTARNEFRILNTNGWVSQSWRSAECTDACWSRDGQVLLLANARAPIVNVINFSRSIKSLQSEMALDLTRTTQLPGGVPGGLVHRMCWSPTSERLAIAFKEDGPDSELIALFGTTWGTLPSFQAIGFIRGPPSKHKEGRNMPTHMQFRPHCRGGALLAVCWAEGQVTMYPMLFDSTRRTRRRR